MSFWKKMLGFGRNDEGEGQRQKLLAEDGYEGFEIRAIEMKVGSEYQIYGEIEKTVAGELRVKTFIRADRLATSEDAARLSLAKARQIIDEQGESLFDRAG